MKNRKRLVSFLAGLMAAVMLLTLLMSILPTRASAASSSEIRKQINQLKKEKEERARIIAEAKSEIPYIIEIPRRQEPVRCVMT